MIKFRRLSIVTVNYKNLNGLISTYHSIAQQSAQQDIEWIVIDGDSRDGTKEWLTNLHALFPVKFVSEEDTGIYNAMNKGIELSENEFVIFLNSGDTFFDNSSLLYIFQNIGFNEDIDLLLFGFKYVKKLHFPRPLWWRYWSMPTSHQAMVYSRSILKSNLYNELYSRGGDFEHFLRIVPKLADYKIVSKIISENEVYGSNANMSIVKNEYEKILSEHIPPVLSKCLVNFKFFYLNLRAKLG